MQIFIESIDKGIWDAIVNEPYTPKCVVENKQVDKPLSEWTDEERRRAQYDCNAKNIITSSLSMDEFFRVSQCKNAKEMWDVLEVTHEGTSAKEMWDILGSPNVRMQRFKLSKKFYKANSTPFLAKLTISKLTKECTFDAP